MVAADPFSRHWSVSSVLLAQLWAPFQRWAEMRAAANGWAALWLFSSLGAGKGWDFPRKLGSWLL